MRIGNRLLCTVILPSLIVGIASSVSGAGLRIRWEDDFLTIRGDNLPGRELRVHYLEAYCRAGSTDQDRARTVIGHTTKLVSASEDGGMIRLRCTLQDGVIVDHVITAAQDEVDFRLVVRNPYHQTVSGPLGPAVHPR